MKTALGSNKLKELPIVILSMSRWDSPISSASWSLAKEFGKNNKVYYVDYPYTFSEWYRGRNSAPIQCRAQALIKGDQQLRTILTTRGGIVKCITPRIVFPVNWLKKGWVYNVFSSFNNKIMSAAIRKSLAEDKVEEFILFNSFNPTYLSNYRKYLSPRLSVYQSRDAIGAINAYTRKHGSYREIEAIRNYDLSIATSQNLSKDLSRSSGVPVLLFPNGGDTELFKIAWEMDGGAPAEIENIKTPIIGYIGNICQRIDYVLVKKIAEAHPDKTLVLLGPREDKIHTEIDLDALPNIVFISPKKTEELPMFLRYFDCAIIPFLINDFTRSIYPLKINEYLASGRAVVTTDFSPDISDFRKHIYLAGDHGQFVIMIDQAIRSNSKSAYQKRYQAAKSNSWELRVEYFWKLATNTYEAILKNNSW
ncbi:glycosyltransferase [Algoriphagus sp. AGSA1]|uniref:glycosyltransferase n=1 Tax=Algoriphagus sp. AGSA1 TaxID=2907213 RepID=UPI001F33B879|nr:glycosyltransferase [Algoriphagus sp. AGSA1]MCE7053738.1 glycosyltransferase [Algoriphagus sp. AGSA1]